MKKPQPSQELHSRVKIRLMEESEREQFDELFEEKRYLRSSRIGGRRLRYVPEADGWPC